MISSQKLIQLISSKFTRSNNNYIENMLHKRQIYYQYNYNPKIEELVNNQIQEEHKAAQAYLKFALTFLHPSVCLQGAGGYFIKMYKEELNHMLQFIQYQLLRGGKPLICATEPPATKEGVTLLEAVQEGLRLEKEITKKIENFLKQAEELKDYHCADFIISVFITEQIQSINEMAQHVTKLTRLKNDVDALYKYDLELAKLYPYSLTIK